MPDRGRPALLHQWKSRRGRQRPVCCSDGSGEFGEDHQESVVQVEIEGQLVVSAAQVLDERMSSTDHSRGSAAVGDHAWVYAGTSAGRDRLRPDCLHTAR